MSETESHTEEVVLHRLTEEDYRTKYPGRWAFIQALDIGPDTPKLFVGEHNTIYEANLCGVLKVAFCLGEEWNIFVRAKDFTLQSDSCSKDEKTWKEALARLMRGKPPCKEDPEKTLQHDISNFVHALTNPQRISESFSLLLDTYRKEIGDPEGPPYCNTRSNPRGGDDLRRRINGPFIAVELLRYFLSSLGFDETPPDPAWVPVWTLIRNMELLGNCPLMVPRGRIGGDRVRDKSQSITKRGKCAPALKGEEDIEIKIKQLEKPALWERDREHRKKIKALELKIAELIKKDPAKSEDAVKLKRENDALRSKAKASAQLATHLSDQIKIIKRERQEESNLLALINFDNIEVPSEELMPVKSYRSLYSGETIEAVIAHSRDREHAYRRLEKADILLKREVIRLRTIIEKLEGKVIDVAEAETQTVLTERDIDLVLQTRKVLEDQSERDRIAHTPSLKGKEAENRLLELLVTLAPTNVTVILTRSENFCGDYMLLYKNEGVIVGYAIIDCKSYSTPVPAKEVEKLKRDINACTHKFKVQPQWAAIVSIESDITHEGKSGAKDFSYGTTPVFLMHSTHNRGDNGSSSIRDLLNRAEFVTNLCPPMAINEESQQELNLFVSGRADKRPGRGRSHSKLRSDRVQFREASTSRESTSVVGTQEMVSATSQPEPIVETPLTDYQEELPPEPRLPPKRTVGGRKKHLPPNTLDPRFFITDELFPQYMIDVGLELCKHFEYKEGEEIKGIDVSTKIAAIRNVDPGSITTVLSHILKEGVRDHRKLRNMRAIPGK